MYIQTLYFPAKEMLKRTNSLVTFNQIHFWETSTTHSINISR